LIVCITSAAVTGVVYNSIFARYDRDQTVPEALTDMVAARTQCSFSSGENMLAGYLYHPEITPLGGLVVLVPGFHAGGDDYLWQISTLLSYGWGVFTFDTTGTFRSEGEDQVGFSQVIRDLDCALKYVENNRNFGYNEIVLMGHSRGGYAACCVLQEHDVAAVVSVSGVNSAMEAVMQPALEVAGPISYGNYGFLWLHQAALFGTDLLNTQAHEALSETDVPVLLIHGTGDADVPADAGAIIAYKEEIGEDHVEYLLWDGGHTDLLYDADGTASDALMASIHAFLLTSLQN
jgi:alpha-beta hydrolase superfamily lysophospholipase